MTNVRRAFPSFWTLGPELLGPATGWVGSGMTEGRFSRAKLPHRGSDARDGVSRNEFNKDQEGKGESRNEE